MRAAAAARTLGWLAALLVACGDGGSTGNEAAAPAETAGLEVRDAWVSPPPAGHGPAGGFLTLSNGSARERHLVGASSPATGPIELHRSWLDGGVARMEPVEALSVPARGSVALEPGGHHLMLHDPGALGDTLAITLEFADGETLELAAEVRGGAHAGHDH